MQKVIYSITKVRNEEKLKGVGYLSDSGDLLVPAISSKGKPYIKVFEEAAKKCPQNPETGEHKGYMSIPYQDVPIFVPKDNNYKIVDYIEVDYHLWFKPIK